MPSTSALKRQLQCSIVLLVSTLLLLLLSSYRGAIEPKYGFNWRFPLSTLASDLPIATPTSIGLYSSRHDPAVNVTSHVDQRIEKRAYTDADFNFHRCVGQLGITTIEAVLNNRTVPHPEFEPSELDNGWTRTDAKMALPPTWRNYFDRQLGSGKIPPANQTWFVNLLQDKDFINRQGNHRTASRLGSMRRWPATNSVSDIRRSRRRYSPSRRILRFSGFRCRSQSTGVPWQSREKNSHLDGNTGAIK